MLSNDSHGVVVAAECLAVFLVAGCRARTLFKPGDLLALTVIEGGAVFQSSEAHGEPQHLALILGEDECGADEQRQKRYGKASTHKVDLLIVKAKAD